MMLHQRGYFNIKIGDKDIVLRFCTWTFKRFCEINGNLTLRQFHDVMAEGFSLSQFISLMLCASEYEYEKKGEKFPYTDMDASDWIDEMGGLSGESFLAMIGVVTESFAGNNNHVQKKSHQDAT